MIYYSLALEENSKGTSPPKIVVSSSNSEHGTEPSLVESPLNPKVGLLDANLDSLWRTKRKKNKRYTMARKQDQQDLKRYNQKSKTVKWNFVYPSKFIIMIYKEQVVAILALHILVSELIHLHKSIIYVPNFHLHQT